MMRWLAVLPAVLLAPAARAQALPLTDPVGIVQEHALAYDRSGVPASIELLAPRTLLGYSADPARGYGSIHLTCRSATDAQHGRCPTADTGAQGGGRNGIALRFTERRSGMRTEITVSGSLQRAFADRACQNDLWHGTDQPLSSRYGPECAGQPPTGTGAALSISGNELSRLVAGRWEAELVLDLRTEADGPALATYTFRLDLDISDRDAASIYFPAFDLATPQVGLNLHYDPISQTVGGQAALEMCLYDGAGSQSDYLGVTVSDSAGPTSSASGYSVWHADGGGDPTQRVDYTVTLDHGGARLPMANGIEQMLTGIDRVRLRLVALPGMTQPVFCVPTPLSLDTPRVPVSSKRPGHYHGGLRVELRLPPSRP